MGALTRTFECEPGVGIKMRTQEFNIIRGCLPCLAYCRGACDALGTYWYRQRCLTPPETTNVVCDCCCKKPAPPPPCICPTPTTPPPPPPSTPSGGQCAPGDTYTETTIPTSNCSDCTNWCKEDCSELGGRVTDDKCAIGESNFVRKFCSTRLFKMEISKGRKFAHDCIWFQDFNNILITRVQLI